MRTLKQDLWKCLPSAESFSMANTILVHTWHLTDAIARSGAVLVVWDLTRAASRFSTKSAAT